MIYSIASQLFQKPATKPGSRALNKSGFTNFVGINGILESG